MRLFLLAVATLATPWQDCLVEHGVQMILWPNSSEYEAHRQGFNEYFTARPLCIVLAQRNSDVQGTMTCAFSFLPPGSVVARSGGHSYMGYSSIDDGILLHLGAMNNTLSLNLTTNTLVVQSGVLLGDLYTVAGAHELIVPGGTCATVGVGGLVQGGGFGYSARMFGLMSDVLLEAEVVLANGTLIVANSTSHADLYWALRGGGGGNFGVAVSFTIRAIPWANTIVRFNVSTLLTSIGEMSDLVYDIQQWSLNLDPRFNFAFTCAFPLALIADGHWFGTLDELQTLLASSPLKSIKFEYYVGAFADLNHDYGHNQHPHMFVATSRMIYEDHLISRENYKLLLEIALLFLVPEWGMQFHIIGPGSGVYNVSVSATAFVHRKTIMSMQCAALFKTIEAGNRSREHFAEFDKRIAAVFGPPAVYLLYPNGFLNGSSEYMPAYYGANAARLQSVKQTYDPTNYFRFPQSIPPTETFQ